VKEEEEGPKREIVIPNPDLPFYPEGL